MTESETAKVLSIISAIWPSFNNNRDVRVTINVWAKLFENESYEQVSAAVLAFANTDTKGFAPMPGALKNLISQAAEPEQMTETEAWALVSKALRNGLYGHEEEFRKLPENIQGVLGDSKILHEWAMLDESQVQTVVASNFQRSYRARQAYVRETAKIPPAIRQQLLGITKNIPSMDSGSYLTEGEDAV